MEPWQKTAVRLKELRQAARLSHATLAAKLKETFGITISLDSLKNYEVADQNHPKAGKGNGMKVEYIRCFAEFFKVSTDYLLGLSDIASPSTTVQELTELTGLSETNAIWLIEAQKANIPVASFLNDVLDIFSDPQYAEQKTLDDADVLVSYLMLTHKPHTNQTRRATSMEDLKELYLAEQTCNAFGNAILPQEDYVKFYAGEVANEVKKGLIRKYLIKSKAEE